jgi:hypothetical protein
LLFSSQESTVPEGRIMEFGVSFAALVHAQTGARGGTSFIKHFPNSFLFSLNAIAAVINKGGEIIKILHLT